MDEVEELAVPLLHRRHERQETQGLLFGARVGGPLEVPQVDDGSARRVVHGGESLESVASRRADRAVVGCFCIQCDGAPGPSGHGHVDA